MRNDNSRRAILVSELTGSLSGRYKINHINDESPKHKFRRGSNLVIVHWKSRMSQMAGWTLQACPKLRVVGLNAEA